MINVQQQQQQQQPPPQMMQPHPQQMFGQPPQRPQFIVGPPGVPQGMPPQRSPHQMQVMPPGAVAGPPPPPHAMIRPGYGPVPAAAIAVQRYAATLLIGQKIYKNSSNQSTNRISGAKV